MSVFDEIMEKLWAFDLSSKKGPLRVRNYSVLGTQSWLKLLGRVAQSKCVIQTYQSTAKMRNLENLQMIKTDYAF